MASDTSLRILILGHPGVGKSAIAVRYLTKRYLGEYLSNTDVMYRCMVEADNARWKLEILDSSNINTQRTSDPEVLHSDWSAEERILWADAVIVVYSIADRKSFLAAQHWLHMVRKIKAEVLVPVILLGNKRDLEMYREVTVTMGAKTATQFSSMFFELSAAESPHMVTIAFENLIREAQLHQFYYPKIFSRCKKPNILAVTKLIIALFGKSPKLKRRRPFLSL